MALRVVSLRTGAFALTLALGSPGWATSLQVVSQTGGVSASGHVIYGGEIDGSSESVPISGVSGVHAVAHVDDNVPPGAGPGYYVADASLSTSFGAKRIRINGDVFADTDPFGDSYASASAHVSIVFEVASASVIALELSPWPFFNAPQIILSHLDLGFTFGIDYFDNPFWSCGSLESETCDELWKVAYGGGLLLPEGSYELEYFQFTAEQGYEASRTVLLTLVPEPASGMLLAAGLLGIRFSRRRCARSARAGASP